MPKLVDRFFEWAGQLTTSLTTKEDADPAIQEYNQAIRQRPNHAEPFYNRGMAYYQLGKDQEAVNDFEKAIELKPDYVPAYLSRGLALTKLGQYPQAVRDFVQVILLQPKEPQ